MIHIVNYGMGNLGSIQNMLKKLGIPSKIAEAPEEAMDASQLILPGVGAFNEGMRILSESGWVSFLNRKVLEDKLPILGICLGMQLMTSFSEEGNVAGLDWVRGQTVRFTGANLRVPHMGWNIVLPRQDEDLFRSEEEELRFYHVHSYYVRLENPEQEIAQTVYGDPFTSAFRKDNIFGVQFHPEKSHKFGMQMLKNFHTFAHA
ncbi:imidazole glycerol phosphate synthase subunit HisH [Pedobacter deserti]|uniref:imidazole glycerol phosphate synthase subunit HisH n=1 Tax=Pedobacter deserti TaxID=2817382 RepID=UPI00210DE52A|nr:imidazole glycerol phosphate synthase subunit HisH [Pedobacter sp. SYSU D00382]